jgi:SPP1 family predicted phage head-tail adaptor
MRMPGAYKERITLKTIVETPDNSGGVSENATGDLATVWAAVKPMKGARLLEFQKLIMGVWYDIELKFRSDISMEPGAPIEYKNQTLNAQSFINENEEDKVILITAFRQL